MNHGVFSNFLMFLVYYDVKDVFHDASDVLYATVFFIPVIHFVETLLGFFKDLCFYPGALGYFFSITVSTKFSNRVFFNGCVFCSVILMFRFIRVFYSLFLFVFLFVFSIRFFSFLRCIFVIYRGDLKRKKASGTRTCLRSNEKTITGECVSVCYSRICA